VRRLFTYTIDPSLAGELAVGSRVRVPFGPRSLIGTVVEWPAEAPREMQGLRAIEAVVEEARRISPILLELTRFVADYYLCSWGEAIEAALPRTVPARSRRYVRRAQGAEPGALPVRATARRALLQALPVDGTCVALAALGTAERRVVRALEQTGLVEVLATPPAAGANTVESRGPRLTPRQAEVLSALAPALSASQFAPMLLYGATASGKTEVYLQAARQVLAAGRGVIYLVPEIGLTPLLLSEVSQRFPGQVAVLHSGLSRGDRYAAWQSARDGSRPLVVGTRSAIFAPLPDVGLIVVDEEQDGSYKQGETPRYNARDLAVVRGRMERAVVLMGSATPSMETFRHARSGRYRLLRLGSRIDGRPLPTVRYIDMRETYREKGEVTALSRELLLALEECVDRGEQALVLRNRRGWAAALFCPTCGERVICDQCSVAMTWHRADNRLRCHHCGLEHPWPATCPSCGADPLKMLGEGTERVADEIAQALPRARVQRMDTDTIRRRGAHETMLRRFQRGEIDVLVGTQMIAKGHDFPRVTLVGVLSADQSLGLPDFRAGERTFQLLTQVAGRAGRGERPGRVLAQAFDPEHPLLRHAATQDYESFYDREIEYRRALRYPPLTALVQILVSDRQAARAADGARILIDALREAGEGRLLLARAGPHPIERLRGRYRWQILVRSAGRRRLVLAVDRALSVVEGKVPRKSIQVDVDPSSLL